LRLPVPVPPPPSPTNAGSSKTEEAAEMEEETAELDEQPVPDLIIRCTETPLSPVVGREENTSWALSSPAL
jgi:hypothetical protein